jgi:hypothetical protein
MIAFIWKLILGGLWRPLLAVLGAAGVYVKGRADAKAKADSRALDATVKGQEAARKGRAEAVEKLRQGQTPEDIVRGNDAKW